MKFHGSCLLNPAVFAPLRCRGRLLKDTDINLTVVYRVVPITGFLQTRYLPPTIFKARCGGRGGTVARTCEGCRAGWLAVAPRGAGPLAGGGEPLPNACPCQRPSPQSTPRGAIGLLPWRQEEEGQGQEGLARLSAAVRRVRRRGVFSLSPVTRAWRPRRSSTSVMSEKSTR